MTHKASKSEEEMSHLRSSLKELQDMRDAEVAEVELRAIAESAAKQSELAKAELDSQTAQARTKAKESALQAKICLIEKQLEVAEQRAGHAETRVTELSAQLEELTPQMNVQDSIEAYELKISELEDHIRCLDRDLNETTDKADRDIDSLRSDLQSANSSLLSSEETVQTLRNTIAEELKKRVDVEDNLANLAVEKERIIAEMQSLSRHSESVQSVLRAVLVRIQVAKFRTCPT